MDTKVKATLMTAGVIAVGVTGGLVGATFVEPEVQYVNVTEEVEVLVPYNVTIEKEVEVEKIVEVPVEDIEFLQLVCDRALFDDLNECKAEITAEDKAIGLAVDAIKSDFAREAFLAGLIVDDRRAELVRVFDEFDRVDVVTSDYDRQRYTFVIEARVEDIRDDVRKTLAYEVDVDNGSARIVDVQSA